MVRVDMGEPRLTRGEIPVTGDPAEAAQGVLVPLGEYQYVATCVSMGNPHCVIFTAEICDYMVLDDGPRIECHELFPRKINVEFAQVLARDEVRMRVWERGAGETMACGTGACATAVAAILSGHCGRSVTVHLLGGDLQIEWSEADNHVYMTGPATEVCEGSVNEEVLARAAR
jgi:diaminopimelate epimerase